MLVVIVNLMSQTVCVCAVHLYGSMKGYWGYIECRSEITIRSAMFLLNDGAGLRGRVASPAPHFFCCVQYPRHFSCISQRHEFDNGE